ncbi:hypothetical protein [Psychroserpens sp.]|uniref:hypothetical protein n=1 Tax=Psychroserpens sp. TaxID=2020870 RepID=UPI001B1D99C5|nr:hypothetical protein [Psychroserpens sp.]MBO6606778.1 hypothetical protein [Psychroserpens sp.]MBO6653481.1 hypothetical protein [Psychroserpens sp.]MBO6680491.1 hypothetical protein [Psychroserpens sp.]MBO6750550.1 hypothetical protein [Psychroserpens sp.]MBO6915033.1 hypothetical protein [Psychroserpens sp.]
MRLLVLIVALMSSSIFAQSDADYLKDVQTLDSTVEALYSVISGEKGEARDWEKFKFLFHKDAKLIPTGKTENGTVNANFMTTDDYIELAGKWLVDNGFHEVEIHRTTNTFGSVTQIFSTYESYKSKNDEAPFARGINSIQLLNDGTRWWVINIYWQQETPDNPIPSEYLPKG